MKNHLPGGHEMQDSVWQETVWYHATCIRRQSIFFLPKSIKAILSASIVLCSLGPPANVFHFSRQRMSSSDVSWICTFGHSFHDIWSPVKKFVVVSVALTEKSVIYPWRVSKSSKTAAFSLKLASSCKPTHLIVLRMSFHFSILSCRKTERPFLILERNTSSFDYFVPKKLSAKRITT